MADRDVAMLAAACRSSLDLDAPLGEEYRYGHLSLCVLDAVFSIGVRYESTQAVVARYAAWAGLAASRREDALPPREQQQPLHVLVEHIERDPGSFATDVVRNRQRTSSRNGILKAEASQRFAQALLAHGVEHLQDVAPAATDPALDVALRAVRGQGSGIAIAYFFMLAGDPALVKPDRMLQRFVDRALGKPTPIADIQRLISDACLALHAEHPALTPRGLDHVIWNHERSRA